MAMIQWSDSLSVGVKEIDQQHQKLIRMINELNDAMGQGKGKDVLGRTLASMASYTASHFAFEEGYFEEYGYPDAAAHRKEHQAFLAKVTEFQRDFSSGRIGLSIQVMSFLSDWLRGHIQGTDRKYISFFREKGLAQAA
jgi:hemerythrin